MATGFDNEETGRRVIRAARKVLAMPTDMGAVASGAGSQSGNIIARLTDEDDSKFAWVAVSPNGNGWTNQPTWDSGTTSVRYAVETNGQDVPIGKVVELKPVANSDHYKFSYGSSGGGFGASPNCCAPACKQASHATVTLASGLKVLSKFVVQAVGSLEQTIVRYISSNIFESDDVTYSCDDGTDTYFWRLTIDEDIAESTLQLIWSGSNTGSGNCTRIELEYRNIWFFDALCGTIFQIMPDSRFTTPASDFGIACQICVHGKTGSTDIDCPAETIELPETIVMRLDQIIEDTGKGCELATVGETHELEWVDLADTNFGGGTFTNADEHIWYAENLTARLTHDSSPGTTQTLVYDIGIQPHCTNDPDTRTYRIAVIPNNGAILGLNVGVGVGAPGNLTGSSFASIYDITGPKDYIDMTFATYFLHGTGGATGEIEFVWELS